MTVLHGTPTPMRTSSAVPSFAKPTTPASAVIRPALPAPTQPAATLPSTERTTTTVVLGRHAFNGARGAAVDRRRRHWCTCVCGVTWPHQFGSPGNDDGGVCQSGARVRSSIDIDDAVSAATIAGGAGAARAGSACSGTVRDLNCREAVALYGSHWSNTESLPRRVWQLRARGRLERNQRAAVRRRE